MQRQHQQRRPYPRPNPRIPDTRGPRVLIAPVTVTPTKALGLSHLKGLLWVDVMYRATGLLTCVDYLYSHTTFSTTRQTAGFWEYLDRACGHVDASACTE